MAMKREIDCRGLNCPQPVINTKKALDEITEGTIITIVDNEVARENVRKFAQRMNITPEIQEREGAYYITITKRDGKDQEQSNKSILQTGNGELVILIGNDKMGTGAEELGTILMKSYLY